VFVLGGVLGALRCEVYPALRTEPREEEDEKLLPALRDAVDAQTLKRLGAAVEKARAEFLGGEANVDGAVNEELEQATKTELYLSGPPLPPVATLAERPSTTTTRRSNIYRSRPGRELEDGFWERP
jgi:hypothetical protein